MRCERYVATAFVTVAAAAIYAVCEVDALYIYGYRVRVKRPYKKEKKRVELLATNDSRHVAFLHEKEKNRRRICGWQEREGRKLCENYYEEE